jgi:hypothetical protein
LLLMPVAGACGTSGSRTWVGSVTTLSPRLCVGRHAATGDCFVASPTLLSGVRAGDCVEVTFKPAKGGNAATLQRVRHVDAKDHHQDCPA